MSKYFCKLKRLVALGFLFVIFLPLMSMILMSFCLYDKWIFVLALSIILLNQTRKTVENKGVEPLTSCVQGRRSSQLS